MADELTKIFNKLIEVVTDATVNNAGLKRTLGIKTKDAVFKRTKSGKAVGKGKTEETLKPHTASYVRKRRFLQRRGKLASDTSPTTSNLTKSGEMLSDLKSDITDTGAIVYLGSNDSKNKMRKQNKGEVMKLTKQEEDSLARTVAASIVLALRKLK